MSCVKLCFVKSWQISENVFLFLHTLTVASDLSSNSLHLSSLNVHLRTLCLIEVCDDYPHSMFHFCFSSTFPWNMDSGPRFLACM